MAIAAGTRFNHYEILAPLGAGGMGEVYRAKDTRLDREVAIKVLPADFANDADRLKRFEQEARATSALNHPNILTVYDIGNHAGAPYLVAELLEGEELRAQLEAGALAPYKALEYAQQIASGLAAAHAKDIVHRDLKPENLFITHDERVKILDFGLAKLRPQRNEPAGSDIVTQKKITDPGTVLGTVGYMSPEQVRGQEVDHRSDIFSFGMILHEMLSGKRAFTGESMADVMSAILKDEPPGLSETNTKISPQLEKLVRRCLEKKPERRFQSTSDLGFALEALPGSAGVPPAGVKSDELTPVGLPLHPTGETPALPGWRARLSWIAAGVFALTTLAFGVAYFRRPAMEAKAVRLLVNPPDKATRFDWPTISPDGRTLAFIATVEGKTQLWVRPLNSTIAKPLPGTEGANYPFWSPDSQFLAYSVSSQFKKIALAGGTSAFLCSMPASEPGAWSQEGVILFRGIAGISRVSATGGAVTDVTTVDGSRGETSHVAPVFLPDGRNFLFFSNNADPARRGIYLTSLTGGEAKLLLPTDNRRFGLAINPAAQNEGWLVFSRQSELLAQPFDLSRQQLKGTPLRLAEQVQSPDSYARFSLSATGELVMIEGSTNQQLVWVDRTGKKLGTVGGAGQYVIPRLSPDGQRLAVSQLDPQTQTNDVRLFDLARGTNMRFTFNPAHDTYPLWSPDGSRLVWSSNRGGGLNFYQKASSGAGQDETLWQSAYQKDAMDWSADGRFILYRETNPQTAFDLWILPMEGERKPWPWLSTPASEGVGKFSPDGKWITYNSNESGRNEIYVQAFVPGAPASGGKWQISTQGGLQPHWRSDGRELYYRSADGNLMAVEVTLGAEVKAGTPKVLFSLNSLGAINNAGYTKTGDGQRFLFVTSAEDASVPPFTVVLNWMAEVKK